MTAETDALIGTPETLTLPVSGVTVRVNDLKTRQMLKLLRIVTRGGAGLLQDFNLLDPSADQEAFTGRFIALVVMAIPDAEDETIEFFASMTEPDGLVVGRKLAPGDKDRNEEIWRLYAETLQNPDLEDLLTLIERIVERESPHIQSLGKRLSSIFRLAQKTGQLDPASTPPTSPASPSSTQTDSSEDSPAPAI